MAGFYKTIEAEQETIINIDYYANIVNIYTCNRAIYQNLGKKLGQPLKEFYIKDKISGACWSIPFEEKATINKILSRPILIGDQK